MQRYDFGTWSIAVPETWSWKTNNDGVQYFEAPGALAGIYAALWDIPPAKRAHPEEVLADLQFMQTEPPFRPAGHWQILRQVTEQVEHDHMGLVESFDVAAGYHIMAHQRVRSGHALIVNIHDYRCADPTLSAQFALGILRSLSVG